MKSRISFLLLVVLLAFSLLACGFEANLTPQAQSPTPTSQPTREVPISENLPPASSSEAAYTGSLEFISNNAFIDQNGKIVLVALLENQTNRDVKNIQIKLEFLDVSGSSTLTDPEGQPVDYLLLGTCTNGYLLSTRSTLVFYSFYPSSSQPDQYTLNVLDFEIVDYSVTGEQGVQHLTGGNFQVGTDANGDWVLTGTLSNPTSQTMNVPILCGVIKDADHNVLSGGKSDLTYSLAPAGDPEGGDQVVFTIPIPFQGGEPGFAEIYWNDSAVEP